MSDIGGVGKKWWLIFFKYLWLIVGLSAFISALVIFLCGRGDSRGSDGGLEGGTGGTNVINVAGGGTNAPPPVATNPPPIKTPPIEIKKRSLTRKPLEPEATKRLADGPQTIELVFEGTGRGSWKKFGVDVSGRYCFTSIVKAISTIDAVKEETARGNFEVTEFRKFVQVQDQLTVDETDVALALEETLPLDTVATVVKGIGGIVSLFNPAVGTEMVVGTQAAREAVKNVDGTSIRGLIGQFGVDVPENVDEYVKKFSTEFCNGKLENVRNKIHAIQGKTYKIVYLQNKEGAPLRVDFTNKDGSPIAEDEWDILKLANVFLDAQIIPDKRVQPGDVWNVDAEVFAGLVDSVANGGTCEGQITVERRDNLPNGDWELGFRPARILTRSEGGATTGKFTISSGNAIGDQENAYVKTMQMVGKGRLGKTKSNRYAIFDFMTKISGDCSYRAMMTTDRKK